MEVNDVLQLIFMYRGRKETMRTVAKSWRTTYDAVTWEFQYFYTDVKNLKNFRAIYPRSQLVVHPLSLNKSELELLNAERSVFLFSIKDVELKEDNCIETLYVRDDKVTDEFFPPMPQLTSLDLTTRVVTDDIFYDMPKLKDLAISYMDNATEIETFPSQLKKLFITGGHELRGDELSEHVSLPVGLRSLTLRFTAFDDGHLYLPLLTFLDVRSCDAMINDAVFEQMPKLEELHMDDPPWLTEYALSSLRNLKVLSTKSGRVACSAVGDLKSLMVCNAEFKETFTLTSRMKASSIENVTFQNLEVHEGLLSRTKVSTLFTEGCAFHISVLHLNLENWIHKSIRSPAST